MQIADNLSSKQGACFKMRSDLSASSNICKLFTAELQ